MTDTNGTERLSGFLDRQRQGLLLAIVAYVWASEGWRVTQVGDTWLRALKDGEVRHLLVVTSGVEHLFGTDSPSADTPVTVVYTGDTSPVSWSGGSQTTVLDASALAQRCVDAGVTDEILDVLRPERDWYRSSSVDRKSVV